MGIFAHNIWFNVKNFALYLHSQVAKKYKLNKLKPPGRNNRQAACKIFNCMATLSGPNSASEPLPMADAEKAPLPQGASTKCGQTALALYLLSAPVFIGNHTD